MPNGQSFGRNIQIKGYRFVDLGTVRPKSDDLTRVGFACKVFANRNERKTTVRIFVSKLDDRNYMTRPRMFVLTLVGLVLGFLSADTALAGNFYQGVSPANVFWLGGVVPYLFATNITAAEQQTYLDGVREWELAANIHFVPRTTQTNWIQFQYAPGTFQDAFVPYTVPETVTVSVLSRAQVCHEMGHALGFTHENIRVDKNTFVTVLTNNIYPASNIYWFTIDPTSEAYGSYDYQSVMHLANNFSSVDPSNLYTQLANAPYQQYQPRMGNLALSIGDRAAAAYLYGPPTVPLSNVVTNTADVGSGSLRAALYYAMDNPGATVEFNIPTNDPGYSNSVFTIYLTGYLPPLVTNGVTIDGTSQPGYAGRPLVVIDGSQMIPEAYAPGTVTGLLIYAANCHVKGLSFQNFNWNGITISYPEATNNVIAGCWCGPDYTGTNAAPNAYQGILIYNGASSNAIGGALSGDRNVLSGNSQYGVYITGTNTVGNVVYGNYIGTTANGEAALGNWDGGMIITGGAYSNTVGGGGLNAGNLLSCNASFGLWIDSSNNLVEGNWMGLDATGAVALQNTFVGMYLINGAQSNSVVGNVLSGNYSEGIRLTGMGTSFNSVQGNFIGTDSSGSNAVPNGFAGLTFYDGAANNVAGGTTAGARNIVSGNWTYGVAIGDPGTTNNLVEGNLVGLSINGFSAMANGTGALIGNGAQQNILSGNFLSGNDGRGVLISDTNTDGNFVEGNVIGLAVNQIMPLANAWEGVAIENGAQSNVIGLGISGAGLANEIAFNGWEGIAVYDNSTIGNTFRGNNIYSNGELGINLVGGTENSYGVTANHSGGAVPGPNDLQNYPVITNVYTSGASTVVSGTFNSTATRGFLIDCYRNVTPDPSGYGDGRFYAGSVAITTAADGDATFFLVTSGSYAGQYFSCTATDGTTGDTSEFSEDVVATNGPAPPSFAGPFTLSGAGFAANISVTAGQSYHVQTTTNLNTRPIVWATVTNFEASTTNYNFVDHAETNSRARFYRVTSP
jgi:hypothetical protein